MPQPIRRECHIEFTGFADLPDHAQRLGNIVGLSGFLESLLGHMLAYLSKTSATVAIPMFHAVSSTDAQKAMLTAAAENTLAGAELAEFRELMSEFRARYRERSRFVHNLWGSSRDHPGKAVWCEAKDVGRLTMTAASLTTPDQIEMYAAATREIYKHCLLYTAQDMEDVFNRLLAYTERVRVFVVSLQNAHPIFAAALAADQPNDEPDRPTPLESPPDQNPA